MYKSNVAYAQKEYVQKCTKMKLNEILLQATSLMKATNNTEQKKSTHQKLHVSWFHLYEVQNRVRSQVVNSQDGSYI